MNTARWNSKPTAYIRALLDEIERVVPSGADEGVGQQTIDELTQLGYRCLETASALSVSVDAPPETVRRPKEGARPCA